MKLTEFTKIGQILAKEHKITIEEGQGWAANIKKRQVFFKKEDIYNLSEEHILGLILHEIAHIRYTTEVTMPKANEELAHATLNMVEDISIEHIISQDYPNAGDILDSTKMEVLDTLVKMLPKMKNVSVYEKGLLYAATRFEGRGYSFGLEPYEKLGDEISKIMIRRKDEIFNRRLTKDLLPIVDEILKLIIKQAGKPSDADRQSLMESGMHGQANEQTHQEEAQKKVLGALKAGKGWKDGVAMASHITFVDAIADQAQAIGKQLRTVLKRNNAMEFGGRYRTGKLMAKRFVRVKAQKDRRPFARRIVKSNQSYAFAVASDVSGSMFNGGGRHGDPGSYALSAMHMVGESLRMAGIPRSMIVFGDKAHVAAPMGKLQIPWDMLANENNMRKAHTGGTQINLAIDACVEQLSKVRAERKILIVLTDGSSDIHDMMESHKKAVQAGIEPLGITIGGNSYMDRTFGATKNVTINDTKDHKQVGKAFIDILKTSVAKSQ